MTIASTFDIALGLVTLVVLYYLKQWKDSSETKVSASSNRPRDADSSCENTSYTFVLLVDGQTLIKRSQHHFGATSHGVLPDPDDFQTHIALELKREGLQVASPKIRFVTVFENMPPFQVGMQTGDRLLGFDFIFFAEITAAELNGAYDEKTFCLFSAKELSEQLHSDTFTPSLERMLRMFNPLHLRLTRSEKKNLPAKYSVSCAPGDLAPHSSMLVDDRRDFCLLDPCFYMFDHPGKGLRSSTVEALARNFSINEKDKNSLKKCIETVHELSLVIDDIQDNSTRRREVPAAHVVYGEPLSINAAYMYIFKLLDAVPSLFRAHHDITSRILVDGLVKGHRGQGKDIYWRDFQYCPTENEYLEMIRGKTAMPFILISRLFFLHCTDWRVRVQHAACKVVDWCASYVGVTVGLQRVEQRVELLLESVAIFFQIRDDYINLTDAKYWQKKGFCDDLHEKKFSFPIVHMIQARKGRYKELLAMFSRDEAPTDVELREGLEIIRETDTLQYTLDYLCGLRDTIETLIATAGVDGVDAIMKQIPLNECSDSHMDAALAAHWGEPTTSSETILRDTALQI